MRAKRRCLRDLQNRPFESDRVVLSHRTLLFETQSPFDLQSTDFSPGGLCLSRLGELAVMHGEMAIKHDGCFLHVFGLGQPQLTDQPVLESVPQSFDSALGLGRMS